MAYRLAQRQREAKQMLERDFLAPAPQRGGQTLARAVFPILDAYLLRRFCGLAQNFCNFWMARGHSSFYWRLAAQVSQREIGPFGD